MSLTMAASNARMTMIGVGWNENNTSGSADSEDGDIIQDVAEEDDYDFGEDINWDDVAQDFVDDYDIDMDDGYYQDSDGIVYTDPDGDGVYENDGYYEEDEVVYSDPDGDGVYTDIDGNVYDDGGEWVEAGLFDYDGDGTYHLNEAQLTKVRTALANLANNEEAIYNYMTDHGDSTTMPARIIVTQDPDQLEYNDGDTIDFTGIVVCAYTSATTRTPFIRQEWAGPRHNQVPYEELTFPVTTATSD